MNERQLEDHLVLLLEWQDAHASFDRAVDGVSPDLYGVQPEGLPFSPWQLLEHMRLTQRDILQFCVDPAYVEPRWPDDYWPANVAPGPGEWEWSVAAFREDREALIRLVTEADLFAAVPNGTGQTFLRELLLVADHNAYHVGQLVAVRRLLDNWE